MLADSAQLSWFEQPEKYTKLITDDVWLLSLQTSVCKKCQPIKKLNNLPHTGHRYDKGAGRKTEVGRRVRSIVSLRGTANNKRLHFCSLSRSFLIYYFADRIDREVISVGKFLHGDAISVCLNDPAVSLDQFLSVAR